MPSRRPRVNLVLEPTLYQALRALARREGVSLSEAARRLIREALELRDALSEAGVHRRTRAVDLGALAEDAFLEAVVKERAENPAPSIPHEELLRRFGIP